MQIQFTKLFALLVLFFWMTKVCAQEQLMKLPKWKTSINVGKAQNIFNPKEPFNIIQCFEGCKAIQQKSIPTLMYGGSIMKKVGKRHYLGIDYNRYQIRLEQQYEDFYLNSGNVFDYKADLTLHGYSIAHQFKIFPENNLLFWNNNLGLDKFEGQKNIFERPNVFYRTGFDIGYSLRRVGLYINPFLQLGLTGYFYETIKPTTYGINAKVHLCF